MLRRGVGEQTGGIIARYPATFLGSPVLAAVELEHPDAG
jgi:hypothetical protein